MAAIKDEVYYKRDNNDEWRGPGKVIGRDGKVVIVKQGGSLREVTRVYITRLRGKKEAELADEEEGTEDVEEEEPETVWESHSEEGQWRGGTRRGPERVDTQDEGWRKIGDGA